MKKIQCETCGSIYVKKVGDGLFECQSCGCQYSEDELKRLLVEISGEVRIDKSKETENILKLGYDAYNGQNYQQAYSYFSTVLQNDYTNADATFMKGLSSAYQSTLAHLRTSELIESSSSAIKLKTNEKNSNEIENAEFVNRIANEILQFARSLHKTSEQHFQEYKSVESAVFEYLERTFLIASIISFAGKSINEHILDACKNSIVTYHNIADFGITICIVVKKPINYKNGTYKTSSIIDGSTIYNDRIFTASLSEEKLKQVQIFLIQFRNIETIIVDHKKKLVEEELAKKRAEVDRYWADHPEEHQKYITELHKREEEIKAKEIKEHEELLLRKKEEEKQKQHKKKIIQRTVYSGLALIAVAGIALFIMMIYIIPSENYKLASEYLKSSNKYNAMIYYSKAGNYKDSVQINEPIQKEYYQDAMEKYEKKDYTGAQVIFEDIGKYQNSEEYSIWCKALRYWNHDSTVNESDFDLRQIDKFVIEKLSGTWSNYSDSYTVKGSEITLLGFELLERSFTYPLTVEKNYVSFVLILETGHKGYDENIIFTDENTIRLDSEKYEREH